MVVCRFWVRGVVLSLMLLLGLSGVARGEDVWRMAGTFNNWNTADEAWELERHPDRSWEFRLERLIEPGRYRFKFVKNGDWGAGHFGSSVDDAFALEQPGEDIELVVEGLAYYRVTLDTQNRRWSQEIAAVEEPIVSAWLYGEARVGVPMVLDLRDTVAGSEPWQLLARYDYDASRVKVQPWSGNRLMASVVPLAAGPTRIGVSVVDGEDVGEGEVLFDASLPVEAVVRYTADGGQREVLEERVVLGKDGSGGVGRSGLVSFDDDVVVQDVTLIRRNREVDRFEGGALRRGVYEIRADGGSLVRGEGEGWDGVFLGRPSMVEMRLRGREPGERGWIRRVHVIGDFNGWAAPGTAGAVELDRVWRDGEPSFEGWVELADGAQDYAFLIDTVRRVADPARESVDDRTSRVIVGDRPGDFGPAVAGGVVGEAVRHEPRFDRYFRVLSDGLGLADVAVRALGRDVGSARVVVERGGRVVAEAPLLRRADASGFDFWEGRVMAGGPEFSYRFVLEDGGAELETEVFAADLGASPSSGGFVDLPDWAKGAVWYQIFAERFRNGNELNDPHGPDVYLKRWQSDWYEVSEGEEAAWRERFGIGEGEAFPERQGGPLFHVVWDRRYGGDLQGVVEKLDYLRSLGVDVIYFNPVFEGESMHKYDATDFRHVDDNFGTPASEGRVGEDFSGAAGDAEDPSTWGWTAADWYFLDVLLPEARSRGIRVVIDGVWNHVGRDFWAWEDVMENGADSEYADWFYVEFDAEGDTESWVAWDGPSGWLPKFRQRSNGDLVEPVKRHLFAVTSRWMDPDGDGDPSDGVDGWRLDVPLDVGLPFWEDWRDHVKGINPDAVIIAEIWSDREADPVIRGEHFDTHMHYPFAHAVTDWLAVEPGMTGSELRDRLDGAFDDLAQTELIHQNLFGSHDTDRYVSMLINPGRGYDNGNRPQDNGPGYVDVRPGEAVYRLSLLGVAMQATHMGAPMVYYGDEVGMWGADDPTDRKPYPWPDLGPMDREDTFADLGLLERYRAWFGLRSSEGVGDVLRYGDQRWVETDDEGVIGYVRSLNGDRVLVIVNRTERRYRAGSILRSMLGGRPNGRFTELDGGVGLRLDPAEGETMGLGPAGVVDPFSARVWYLPID